jgi:uncharacterized protein (DUF362 family)
MGGVIYLSQQQPVFAMLEPSRQTGQIRKSGERLLLRPNMANAVQAHMTQGLSCFLIGTISKRRSS